MGGRLSRGDGKLLRPAGALRLPDDLVCSALGFNDLRSRFACVAACSTLRDAHARLSPGLERGLVLRRFPLLTTIVDDSCTTPPRQLFLSQQRLFESRGRFPSVTTEVGLDRYTFSVEIELYTRNATGNVTDHQSIYVGTGSPVASETFGALNFDIPQGVWRRADVYQMNPEEHPGIHTCSVRLMVTRRNSGRIERAQLFEGVVEDGDADLMVFDYCPIPRIRDNAALDWALRKMGEVDMYATPHMDPSWTCEPFLDPSSEGPHAGPSKLKASFMLMYPDDSVPMTLEDSCLVLEHYVDWTPL